MSWYFLAHIASSAIVIGPFADELQAKVNADDLTRDRRGALILLHPWECPRTAASYGERPPPPPRPDASTDTAAKVAP